MIEIRKVTDKEKKNFVNADYVIHFGGAKRYFTEKAIEELRCKLNKLLLDDVIKCNCKLERHERAKMELDYNKCMDCKKEIH